MQVLEEAYRVLTPGGRFMCLEFSQLPNSTLQWYETHIQLTGNGILVVKVEGNGHMFFSNNYIFTAILG